MDHHLKVKPARKILLAHGGTMRLVKAKAQISAISGRIIEQKVTFVGKEKLIIGDKTFNTLHFNFKSSDESLPEKKA